MDAGALGAVAPPVCGDCVADVVLAASVEGCVVVGYERVGVGCACTWYVVGDGVVDGLPAYVAVAADLADVFTHPCLHGAVAADHGLVLSVAALLSRGTVSSHVYDRASVHGFL